MGVARGVAEPPPVFFFLKKKNQTVGGRTTPFWPRGWFGHPLGPNGYHVLLLLSFFVFNFRYRNLKLKFKKLIF
jgi:hypothetical protein